MEAKVPPAPLEAFHALSPAQAAEKVGSDLERGLTQEEAQARLMEAGPNELTEGPRRTRWQMLLDQFRNFLVIILLVASLVSLLIGERVEAGAIMAIVVLNAVLGVVQESKAEDALRSLKRMSAPEARVLRSGHTVTVPARELVRGDVAFLEAGYYIPADLRLTQVANLQVDEAALTGESVPVEKEAQAVLPQDTPVAERVNMCSMGTLATYGRGTGLVVETGMATQVGQIAELLRSYEEEATPLQKKLAQLGRVLGMVTLAICAVIFGMGLVRGIDPLEMFITAVSLAIAAVPEGLPAVVTVSLALGMQRMVRRHALIRKLAAVETLGSATVICSDKTGTLTQNQMAVRKLHAGGATFTLDDGGAERRGSFRRDGQVLNPLEEPALRELLLGGLLCSDARLEKGENPQEGTAWRLVGDPTEAALVMAAAKAGLFREEVEKASPRLAEIPFSSERKRMTTLHPWPDGSGYIAYVKGAPDILAALSSAQLANGKVEPLTEDGRARILAANEEMANQALRVLGVARRHLESLAEQPQGEEVERDLIFLGLVGMLDPVRPEVKAAVRTAREAGIRTVMITGDYRSTAIAVAEELNLLNPGHRVLSGAELEALDDAQLYTLADEVTIYARVSPQHKVRIVEALKSRGHVVAMTGDGVNDAPALQRADIGVAMGITGTDVSKGTADMVLTDDNYASIVAAVEEGRIIYGNIRKFVFYLLSCNLGEILTIFVSMLFRLPLPLAPIQLLWLNLLTDGAPALALGMEAGGPDTMKRPPRPPHEPIISRDMLGNILLQGGAIAAATLGAFVYGLRRFPGEPAAAQTFAFVTLTSSELLRAYTARSERLSLVSIGVFSNRYMQAAVAVSLALLLVVVYVPWLDPIFHTKPLALADWLRLLPLMLVPSTLAELGKLFLGRGRRASTTAIPR